MTLPNYFLADLPPEATLSPTMITEACLTLKRNRAQYLAQRSTHGLVELLCAAPARLFGLGSKGSLERGRDADLVLFDPSAERTIRAADLHHTSDYTAFEGLPVRGAVQSVFVRGRPVIRDGLFVGQRGFGQFVERRLSD